ncbi:unnamed protein product [Hymenolepis diminuta]|uniref:FERM domain-containing protein n=1 Tax=Hymenolepis diminuta TaxID=6216 RepID=A0A564Y3Z6_HYMDI|nr:unnamed protein product [Hymenolepis diminuta]
MAKSKNGTEQVAKITPNSKKSLQSPKSSKSSSTSTPIKTSDLVPYKIRLLDSEQKALEIFISKNDEGQVLFDKVCNELGGIVEKDYFGLRYMDKNNQRQWLDLGRNVKKQMTGAHSSALSFRVKHYPGNPITDFHQEISQYLLYLQIRRDLVQGRLLCPLNELYTMGGLILQSEYGDAPEDEGSGELNGSISDEEYKAYFKNFKIVFNQTKKIESEIIARHRMYRGLTARDAEVEVIRMASKLPTYGVDPFPVKVITKEKTPKKVDSTVHKTGDSVSSVAAENKASDTQSIKSAPANPTGSVYLGLRHTGLTTYVGLQPSETIECKSGSQLYIGPKYTQNYSWNSIERLACDGKDFIVYVKPQAAAAKPRVVTFRCDTKAAALALWKWTVDRQSFFTLKQASEAKTTKSAHGLFRRSHSYRFIGKSQMELKSIANSSESLPQPSFMRVSSLRRPKSHEGEFDQFSARATLPARIRTAENGSYSMSDPVKRPSIIPTTEYKVETTIPTESSAIPTTNAENAATPVSTGVMNIANDLRTAPGLEVSAPINESVVSDPVTVVPVSVNPIAAAPVASATPQSTDVDEVRQRTNHTNKLAVRDSECLRAVNEIDQVIDNVQGSNGRTTKTLPNGEVSSHEIRPTTSRGHATRITQSESIYSSSLIIALEAAALIGVACITVMIAALETSQGGSGRQSNSWTELAMNLRGHPIVASFNEYIYSPLRGFFIDRGH